MAHAHGNDPCGCFPTGKSYPGIADLLLRHGTPVRVVGMAPEFAADEPIALQALAVIDTETTGKDPSRGDRVVEVAVVHFDNGEVSARHAFLVNPGIPIPKEASDVHGITDDQVKTAPRFDAIANELAALLGGRLPVAYNADFDRQFIHSEMQRAGVNTGTSMALAPSLRTNVEWLDPLLWARGTLPGEKSYKLGDVSARLGIPLDRAHRATDDAEAAGRVLLTMLRDQTVSYREFIQRQREYKKAWRDQRANWRR